MSPLRLAAAALVLIPLGPPAAHAGPGAGGMPGAIAFVSDRDSPAGTVIDDVYVRTPRATHRVTRDADVEWFPSIAPDGRWLAFGHVPTGTGPNPLGSAELRVCPLRWQRGHLSCGPERTLVPAGRFLATSPFSWTPDGRRILYAGPDAATGDADVFSVRTRGPAGPVNLTQEADGSPARTDLQPDVSPDGRFFVHGSSGDIVRRRLDGADPVALTSGPRVDVAPELSPGGRRLAFQVNAPGDFDILTMAVRPEGPGNMAVNLTAGRTDATGAATQERFPTWSPDGRRIAYQRHVAYNPGNPFVSGFDESDIWSMRADGSDARNLTDNNDEGADPPIGDIMPDWGVTRWPAHGRPA